MQFSSMKFSFQVEIIRITSINFQFDPLFEEENIDRTEYTVKFQGYIHPLNAESSNGPPLKVFLVSVAAHAYLYISLDDSKENKVRIRIEGWKISQMFHL